MTRKILDSRATCSYCGEPANELEHVVPRSKMKGVGAKEEIIVPTCYECNRLAGAALHKTLKERALYIKERLRKKYRDVLTMPDWDEGELEELGPSMRDEVVRNIRLKKQIVRRILWSHHIDARGGKEQRQDAAKLAKSQLF